MTDIQAVNSPPISDTTLYKLTCFLRPTRMDANTTQFDIGYERCKQDLAELLEATVGKGLPRADPAVSAAQRRLETQARSAAEQAEPQRWWQR